MHFQDCTSDVTVKAILCIPICAYSLCLSAFPSNLMPYLNSFLLRSHSPCAAVEVFFQECFSLTKELQLVRIITFKVFWYSLGYLGCPITCFFLVSCHCFPRSVFSTLHHASCTLHPDCTPCQGFMLLYVPIPFQTSEFPVLYCPPLWPSRRPVVFLFGSPMPSTISLFSSNSFCRFNSSCRDRRLVKGCAVQNLGQKYCLP